MSQAKESALLQSLNKAQCRAVRSGAPTVAILAGPGSGKTHTLTSRVVWLIDHLRIQPCDVIVATFTVKASNEMKARIGQALGDGREKKIILGTFHSIARRYLAAYGKHIGLHPKFGIADDSDSRGAIARICKRLQTHIDPGTARGWISKRKAKGTSDEQPMKSRNGQSIESQAYEQCYQEYQSHLERSNLLDYDDLLIRCVELLRKFPNCVSNIQTVLIDEYQDTNGVQYDLMRLFAQKNRRITIVGDPDQSIYGWRSAEIKNLHRLLRDYPGTDEISLEENYRSSSSILDTSLKVIQQDQDRYKKVLLPVHGRGTRPVHRQLKSTFDEAEWIISEIKRLRLLSGKMIDYDDISILLRSASLSRHIETVLGREGIAYRMIGGFKFYDRAEIKVLLEYLKVIHQPENNDAVARIINVPKRGIGDKTIKDLLEEAERGSMSLWSLLDKHCQGNRKAKTNIRKQTEQKISGELMRPINNLRKRLQHSNDGTSLSLVDLVQQLLRDLHFEDYLEDTYGPEYESRWANVQEFVNLADEFTRQGQVEEETLPNVDEIQQASNDDLLARFLANVTLASDKQTDEKDGEDKPLVTISTIHAAKGLEWPVVFIPAVYKGSIPHSRSEDLDEERRLLYVAMTRAKAFLYLSTPQSAGYGGGSTVEASPFIANLSSSTFLPKGPSFDRPVMSSIARMLGRELPTDEIIYKGMPDMTAPEDNVFPVDPNKPIEPTKATAGVNLDYSAGPRKRQKVQHPQVNEDSVEGWNAPYRTTMEKAGTFTVPKPGFTTAGAHYATVTAAEAKNAAAKQSSAPTRRPLQNRVPAQRSLLGYGYGIIDHDRSKQPADEPVTVKKLTQIPASAPYARRAQNRRIGPSAGLSPQASFAPSKPTLPAALEPSLAGHKLGTAKMTRPATTSREVEAPSAPKQYSCFSSSPPQPDQERGSGKENIVIPPPKEDLNRPAASFHATTVHAPMGSKGGIKRPVGLGRSVIAPMDRLNKPYKLTVKRPGNP